MKIDRLFDIKNSLGSTAGFTTVEICLVNKINELIDKTNENTEILVKTIQTFEKFVDYSNKCFYEISESFK